MTPGPPLVFEPCADCGTPTALRVCHECEVIRVRQGQGSRRQQKSPVLVRLRRRRDPTMTPLQELIHYLDHPTAGDRHMAWYGQLRAEGLDHEDALEATIQWFRLDEQRWWQQRHRRFGQHGRCWLRCHP